MALAARCPMGLEPSAACCLPKSLQALRPLAMSTKRSRWQVWQYTCGKYDEMDTIEQSLMPQKPLPFIAKNKTCMKTALNHYFTSDLDTVFSEKNHIKLKSSMNCIRMSRWRSQKSFVLFEAPWLCILIVSLQHHVSFLVVIKMKFINSIFFFIYEDVPKVAY